MRDRGCRCLRTRSKGGTSSPRKSWNSKFSKKQWENHVSRETLFIESLEQNNVQLSLQETFLQDAEISGSSWEVEQVRKFFRAARTIPGAKVWMDFRVKGVDTNEHQSRWLQFNCLGDIINQQVCRHSLFIFKPILIPTEIRVPLVLAGYQEASASHAKSEHRYDRTPYQSGYSD